MTEDITTASSEKDKSASEHKLTTHDYNVTTLRSYFLQNGFNYSNYQGLGYGLVLYPAFKKIYGENTDRLAKELEQNSEFYNTNPNFLPFITSLHLAMADEGADYEDIRGIKMALMGPLAGIGDSLSQFCIAPLFSTIFASLAMSGVAAAPLLFLVAMNGVLISIKFAVAAQGRKLGTTIIDKLSSELSTISETASMIGVTVISGLVATYVKMNVGISFAAGAAQRASSSLPLTFSRCSMVLRLHSCRSCIPHLCIGSSRRRAGIPTSSLSSQSCWELSFRCGILV